MTIDVDYRTAVVDVMEITYPNEGIIRRDLERAGVNKEGFILIENVADFFDISITKAAFSYLNFAIYKSIKEWHDSSIMKYDEIQQGTYKTFYKYQGRRGDEEAKYVGLEL